MWMTIVNDIDSICPPTHMLADRMFPPIWMKSLMTETAKPSKSAKREKFRELAESRTNRAIDAILRIGNLSNRQIYEWDDAEVKKVLRALREAINSVEGRFESPRGKMTGGFKL